MNRPDRQKKNLVAKLERKLARSKKPGPKAKRWKQVIDGVKIAPKVVEEAGEG